MGTAASNAKSLHEGVPINPRVEYASEQAKRKGQALVIDAPVLVNLSHGTVRYRYMQQSNNGNDSGTSLEDDNIKRIEKPHEGAENLQQKKGYFYHTKLEDYSGACDTSKEPDFKFKYVSKGPLVARNKHLYFVTGKGLKTQEDIHSGSLSGLNTPVWPNIRTEPNHVYYELHFVQQGNEPFSAEEKPEDSDVIHEHFNKDLPLNFVIQNDEVANGLKEQVSMRILKPTGNIHIFYNKREIEDGVVLSMFSPVKSFSSLKIRLLHL